MFRDSRGVVHTVCSPDPLSDLPPGAAAALLEALVVLPADGAVDRQQLQQRCHATVELLERWQDAFFAALPDHVDPAEEARAAADAGVSLAELEAELSEELGDDALLLDPPSDLNPPDDDVDLELDAFVELAERENGPDDPRHVLPTDLVAVLERELLLLPMRSRLEALVACVELAESWADLLTDHEKLLGHVILAHGCTATDTRHDALLMAHGRQHRSNGPGHAR